jgi:hypothetical protein
MRALDSLRRFLRWRWFPFVVPVLLALVYVLLAVWLVPESFTPAHGDEQTSDQPGDRKGASSGSRTGSTPRSRRVSDRSAARLSRPPSPADDSATDDQGPGAEDESRAADDPDEPDPGEPE